MKFSYKFSNLLGAVYRKGNLLFTSDGNSIVSPVGNRVSVFDLKNNKSETLPIESKMNITATALSPDGSLMIIVNEEGDAMLVSLLSRSVLHHFKMFGHVNAIKFSPDGKRFAITKENSIVVYYTPGKRKEFNPMVIQKVYRGAYDENVCIDWTSDSRVFCAGSKDMSTRVYATDNFRYLGIYSLGGHHNAIVGAFFMQDSLDAFTICRRGHVCVWECALNLNELEKKEEKRKKTSKEESEEKDTDAGEDKEEKTLEPYMTDSSKVYTKLAKHNFREARKDREVADVTSVAYHKAIHIMVTGFQDGAFFLHDMPEFQLIHSLSISDQSIDALAFNTTGDWIGLGCSGMGQLLVWEWQSESYVLKQQGHFSEMNSVCYSPDGMYIATGGDDGKVKVWNTSTGFCFVTLSDHNAPITKVIFNQNGQVLLSSSLDGTVRAFDLVRYRNFRTFTSPRPIQFGSLATDHSGEIVCAGGMDTFEIYVWSMQTGRLLDILAGHQAPVSSLAFCPAHSILVSGSWDKTVKLWDVFESKGAKETIQVGSDVLDVAYKPDGKEVAVAGINGQITFWDTKYATQTHSIEGRRDLGYSRKETDKITAKKSSMGKAFNSICYTADGKCLMAAGKSKNVCIYSIADQLLIKKFEIMCNLSFDGTQQFLDRRKMTEFGSLALVDEGQGDNDGKDISLPGVKKGDLSSRHYKPEVRVTGIQFSPTGRAWACTSTEGLLVYSLDHNIVFDPFQLEVDITPENVASTLQDQEYSTALLLAFRLNEQPLIQQVVENIPVDHIELISRNLPDIYVDKMLTFAAANIENSAHVDFYLIWIRTLLVLHGARLKQRSAEIMPVLRTLQKNLTVKYEGLSKVCDHNRYLIDYVLALEQIERKRTHSGGEEGEEGEEEMSADESGDELKHIDQDSDSELENEILMQAQAV